MLRMPENEFERRLLWRPRIDPTTTDPKTIDPKTTERKPIEPEPFERKTNARTAIEPKTNERPAIEWPRIAATAVEPKAVEQEAIEQKTVGPKSSARRRSVASLEQRLKEALPIKRQLDSARRWSLRSRPDFRRAYSAGCLLFQVVGIAGYAGYFVSMHTLMRISSGLLLAGTWYAIYRIKRPPQV